MKVTVKPMQLIIITLNKILAHLVTFPLDPHNLEHDVIMQWPLRKNWPRWWLCKNPMRLNAQKRIWKNINLSWSNLIYLEWKDCIRYSFLDEWIGNSAWRMLVEDGVHERDLCCASTCVRFRATFLWKQQRQANRWQSMAHSRNWTTLEKNWSTSKLSWMFMVRLCKFFQNCF